MRFGSGIAGLVVLLAAEFTDAADSTSQDVFSNGKVWQFHVKMTAAEYAALQPAPFTPPGFPGAPMPAPKKDPKPADPNRETHKSVFGAEYPWAEAAITFEGKTLEKVGIRYKGNATYMMASQGLKRSLKVDLDRYDDKARFQGLKSLTLNCGVFDPSKCREALAYSIYRTAGVPAPRTAFAEVLLTVPGKYDAELLGVFTLVETVDKDFLKANFKNNSGLLMKPERIRSLDYLGEDWSRYESTYQPKREATKEEIRRVIDFTKVVNMAPDDAFTRMIPEFLDIDSFLKYMASTAIIANFDSFFTSGHNYCLYLHPTTNKFHFIPWDLDLALGAFPFTAPADQMNLSLVKQYPGNCRLADRLLANPEIAGKYQQILKELAGKCFEKEKLFAEIADLEKVVKPLIARETKAAAARKEGVGGFGAPPGVGGPFGRTPELKTFVEKRSDSIEEQLAGRSKGYIPVPFGPGGPGGPGGPQGPKPGDVLAPQFQNALQMTEKQKRELAELQKKVDAELEQILTPEQRSLLKRIREGGGPMPGGGFPPKR